MKKFKIEWLAEPKQGNFVAALSYLSLLIPVTNAEPIVAALKRGPIVTFKAKDIFRASSLPLLGISNVRVKRDKKKIKKGEPLSPILLVRDHAHRKVIVADGYHRLCAVYQYNEEIDIPCIIATLN